MIDVDLIGIGLRAPGLANWTDAREILSGRRPWVSAALPASQATGLPATERRRASRVARLAIDAASEALGQRDPAGIASVFASSGGEVEVVHGLFEQLAGDDRRLSPMAFHNSVHNAAAGYWSIATGSEQPTDSLCAFDDSFGTGLAEALLRCADDRRPVLLVAYDLPPLFPIAEFRAVTQPVAVALLLAPPGQMPAIARLQGLYQAAAPDDQPLTNPQLETLRQANPAARALPLLGALALGQMAELSFGHGMQGRLALRVTPCN